MRAKNEHWKLLLDICEKNPELLTNKFNGPEGKAKGNTLWLNVSHQLNGLGFGEKSVEEWRRALVDWKSKTKAKASKLREDMNKTGGGPPIYPPLTDLEKRLIQQMGARAVYGDEVPEFGFGEVKVITVSQPAQGLHNNDCCQEEIEFLNAKPSQRIGSQFIENHSTKRKHVAEPAEIQNATPSTSQGIGNQSNALSTPSNNNPQKRRRIIRPQESERLSRKLIDINEKSLIILEDIAKNSKDIAASLKSIIANMQDYFNKQLL